MLLTFGPGNQTCVPQEVIVQNKKYVTQIKHSVQFSSDSLDRD